MPTPKRTHRFGRWLPWIISGVLHIALIAGGFVIVWRGGTSEQIREPAIVSFDAPELAERATDDEQQADQPEIAVPELPAMPEVPQVSAPEPIVDEQLELPPTEQALEPLPRAPTVADVRPEALPRPVRFFNLRGGTARRIVYVVDASASMVGTFPIVVEELERSLRRLVPAQEYQVLFIRDGRFVSMPHPADPPSDRQQTRLIRATARHLDLTMDWIDTVTVSGGSNPLLALDTAVFLEPDAVFLLSREITGLGEFDLTPGAILEHLDETNPRDTRTGLRGVKIQTIQFLDQDPSGLLRKIGTEHGGDNGWVFLSRDDLTRRRAQDD